MVIFIRREGLEFGERTYKIAIEPAFFVLYRLENLLKDSAVQYRYHG